MKSETKGNVNKLRLTSGDYAGLEIFHLFIKILLGGDTSAARIFESKSEVDFSQTKVVSMRAKYLAIMYIIVINVFFVVLLSTAQLCKRNSLATSISYGLYHLVHSGGIYQ